MRKPMKKEKKRMVMLCSRMTEKDAAVIRKRAAARYLTVSNYLRLSGLGVQVPEGEKLDGDEG